MTTKREHSEAEFNEAIDEQYPNGVRDGDLLQLHENFLQTTEDKFFRAKVTWEEVKIVPAGEAA